MDLVFATLAFLTLAAATAAMSLRNLIHCALCLALAFTGLAGLYLRLNAQFVGFAQILVYVGAVAILIVFAILLTRNSEAGMQSMVASPGIVGTGVAVLVFGALVVSIRSSSVALRKIPPPSEPSVKKIGEELMTNYVLPLEVIALLLTAAMIGAVIIAMQEKGERS